jgi:AhpD family alkylhydroperoxidase
VIVSKAPDAKTKELIALGIAVAVRCDDCIAFHVKAAVERGATKEEVTETLAIAIYMGAGPSAMYATHAIEAYSQFTKPPQRDSFGLEPAELSTSSLHFWSASEKGSCPLRARNLCCHRAVTSC